MTGQDYGEAVSAAREAYVPPAWYAPAPPDVHPSLGQSLVGPPIARPRPALREMYDREAGLFDEIELARGRLGRQIAQSLMRQQQQFVVTAVDPDAGVITASPFRGIDRSVAPASLTGEMLQGSYFDEAQSLSAEQIAELAQRPNPMLQMIDRKTLVIRYVPCSLPEQLPARDALATLAVSRDADEEHPDEHAPGSRGHVMRRTVGCDFRVRGRLKNGKPSRAVDRRGDDRRIAWAEQRRAPVYDPTLYAAGVFRMGSADVQITADPNVPRDRMYTFGAARNPHVVYMNPQTYAALVARIGGVSGT